MDVWNAPMLSPSPRLLAAESAVRTTEKTISILDSVIQGVPILEVAQKSGLSEKELRTLLAEALAESTEFLKTKAETYQQIILQRHEEMYTIARQKALEESDEDEPKDGKKKRRPVDINWFREMRASLLAIQAMVMPHIKGGEEKKTEFHVTIVTGDQMHQKAAHLQSMADDNVFNTLRR